MRYAGVFKNQLGVLIKTPARLIEFFADAKARRIGWHDELGRPFGNRFGEVGACTDKKKFADTAVSDEGFFTVQYPVIAVALGLQTKSGFWITVGRHAMVRSDIGFGARTAQHIGVIGDEGFEKTLLLIGRANHRNQLTPLPVLTESLGDRTIATRQLGHHHALRNEIGTRPPPVFGHAQCAKTKLRTPLDDVPIPGRGRIGNLLARE